ncbi:unnamed protein product [Candidula unifasciata]|uniref:Matrix-remodeling-associated protein 7 helical domain-containing protein n=1 Tax=Candidula unifasciata TaxID=100452 RepID=A0A8S3ZF50_9EUPU|nr:unnamed protein product [Candidula unifasciata]
MFMLRKIFNIRSSSKKSKKDKAQTDHTYSCLDNASAGNDGDDAELSDGQDTQGEESRPAEITGQMSSPRYQDPLEYCEHIQGEFKRVQQSVATKTIEKSLTEQQLMEEKEIQRKQLAEIFRLMQEQEERFGIGSMDDMKEQMKLYALSQQI